MSSTAALAGRIALVTGASGGIGQATAIELARHGADVAVHYHQDQTQAERTARAIEKLQRRAICVQADLASDDAHALADTTHASLGFVDSLVLNAGIYWSDMSAFVDLDDWDLVMRTNVRGPLAVCQAFVPAMLRHSRGSIVFVGSRSAQGSAGAAAYAASKAALVGLARSMARELAGRGIRVNVVAPGLVNTPMLRDELEDGERGRAEAAIGLKRLAEPDEIARPIRFLLSDEASYVTGAVLDVDGILTL